MTSNVLTISDLIAEGLGEVKTGPFGTALKAAEYQPTGHPVIAVKDIRDGFLEITPDTPRISKEKAQELSPYILRYGDILFGRKGAIDRFAFIREHEAGILMGSDCIRLRLTDIHEARFLAIYFRTSQHKRWMIRNAEGSTMASLNQRIIERIEIPNCASEIKHKAIEVASSLDDKIELNRRMNQTLEAMAQAIFQSWFVDFDPVKAKMAAVAAGRDPERAAMAALAGKLVVPKNVDEISLADLDAAAAALDQLNEQQQVQLAQTAALFPTALMESELGLIPMGWEVGRLDDILELAYGRALKQEDRISGPFPVYGSGGVTGNHDEFLVSGPGIIVGRKGTVGSIYWEDQAYFPIDTTFYVIPKRLYSLEYIFYLLEILGLDSMNTDAAVPGLNRNNAYRLEIVKPESRLIDRFTVVVAALKAKINNSLRQSKTLAQLRDTLLPKLLSGEFPITDLE